MTFRRKIVFFLTGLSNFSWKNGRAGWLAGWLERNFHTAFRGKSVGSLAGWLPGWLAGGVLSCICMVNHFERDFTWLSDAN